MATRCTNPAYRRQEQITDTNPRRSTRQTNPPEIGAQENDRNAQSMATSRTNPAYRRQEQITDTNPRRLTRQTNPPEIRAQENERNAQAMVTSCTNPAYRRQEQIPDTNHRRLTRQTKPPEIGAQKMKGMLKLWQQVVLIQHTAGRSKLMIQIEEGWQESNHFFMTCQLSSILQVAHTYIIILAGYGMKNVVMGVGTFICQVHQVSQKGNVVQMVLCLLLVATLMKD
jgi:hypothetical protein